MAGKGIRWFVSALEKSGFDVCNDILGEGKAFKGSVLFPESTGATGVWANNEHKIMSIGKAFSLWIRRYNAIFVFDYSEDLKNAKLRFN